MNDPCCQCHAETFQFTLRVCFFKCMVHQVIDKARGDALDVHMLSNFNTSVLSAFWICCSEYVGVPVQCQSAIGKGPFDLL